MTADTTDTFTSGTGEQAAKTTANTITAAHFTQMLDIVDSLVAHGHTFNDNYGTNCECQCQRGSL
jgi:hypothetical protein